MPAVSVIIPVYKVEAYIERCVRSVLAQTMTDYEIILVDDGSPDRSAEIAEQVLAPSGAAYRIVRQSNQGLGAARERGVREASGEWVSCVDADDIVAPDFLETLLGLVNKYGTQAAAVSYHVMREGEPIRAEGPGKERVMEREAVLQGFLLRKFRPVLPALLINRRFLADNGIHNNMECRFSEDAYYFWQVFFSLELLPVSDRRLYYYIQRETSIMHSSKAENILTGYRAIKRLVRDHSDKSALFPCFCYLLPRWVLSALRSTARIAAYPDFLSLAERMNYREAAKALSGFPEIKARILAALLRIHPRLFYWAVRAAG